MSSKPSDLPKMKYRYLGRSGLQVSAISLGGWLTYGGYAENEKTFACMKAAYDCGINFFDCAEGYAGGESERVMGEAIKKFGWKRNDLVISTKIYWGDANGEMPVNNAGLSRKHIIEGVDLSLKRLQLDYVDLIYAHRPDRNTPLEETVRAFNHVINTGKAFYWGTSEWNADEIASAHRIADKLGLIGPVMEQPEYSLLKRNRVEGDYILLYEHYGLGLTTFSPLAGGVLTGKYLDGIPEGSRIGTSDDPYIQYLKSGVGADEWEEKMNKVRKLKGIADKLGCNCAQLALAWVLKNDHVSSAITGASRPEQIYDSVKALAILPKLSDALLGEIDEIWQNRPPVLERVFY
ncbi:hypothetical protein TWF173_011062 [Orbilia oligospora]|uniref:NADP-dependent oxidoreductase domain-containing protein n=2 Tax=Orbilia oligospora TaxID=2813651 RepID=G1XND8_ARTOA|nr:hypothetical protein AOL_s00170g104 [Orbilia oligospora ATCC 24927]EGX45397.1 hypothetical protein AOL_s00170g104 [Orbilia oligospora ATCC 24927]KAF3284127.1 hypothetical protein TWF970_011348 [Orbilia oligospora]KAF3317408.1 hypothetical protein TWF173_011062 [Orbilia oligospora]